jgi:hypothetical protein
MGFHVHIDVSTLSIEQLIKVCQNFVKYEDVFDSLLPPSRRTKSPESNRFFQSNRDAIGYSSNSNRERHQALENCQGDITALASMMNPKGRYYKLNLQNLSTQRQLTLEFRQHSATVNYQNVSAWIRLCAAFVRNSACLAAPKPFQKGRTLDFQFNALFYYVIKDRALCEFYRVRAQELAEPPIIASLEDESCCTGCAQNCGRCS